MNDLKQVIRTTKLKVILGCIALICIMAVCCNYFTDGGLEYLITSRDIYYDNQIKDMSFSKATVIAVLDAVGEDDEGVFYAVPDSNEGAYLVYVYNEYTEPFNSLMESFWSYNDGVTAEYNAEPMEIKGLVWALDDTDMEAFRQWGTESEYCADGDTSSLKPYCITYIPTSMYFEECMVWIIVFGAFAVLFLCILIRCLLGGLTSRLRRYVRDNNLNMEDLERDFELSHKEGSLYIGREYCFLISLGDIDAVRISDIVWAYKHIQTTRHSVYFIPVGKTQSFGVVIVKRNGKRMQAGCAKEAVADQILRELSVYPHIIMGYDESLDKLAKKKLPELVAMSDALAGKAEE